MMINKIDGINPLSNVQNTRRSNVSAKVESGSDSISVSDEAKKMAEAYYLNQVADETPDVRTDLVMQIKEKIKDPNYINSQVLNSVADRIMESYGL
ncbi:MAG: flagellar biosynthesis anti-sigma factor FlgM [Treponema sp.]|nr:flagellar biosynthesis anti-sigma factor FlgM [Treponema sp.]